MQTILVIGGAGYIGSHMVLKLNEHGYRVIVLDNLSKGHADAVINAELIIGDMADKNLLSTIFTKNSISAVMHFAAFIEVGESVKLPAKYYQNNLAASLNLLEVMLQHQVKKFILSSTAAVYGEPQYTPINEAHPLAPINPYGKSKYMLEEILKDFVISDNLHFASLRYFNAAGADPQGRLAERHDPETHLIPLILQVANGERAAISVYGRDYPTQDGTCIRDFVHVSDLCDAHLLALQSLEQGETNLFYNLGTGHGYSVQQVIQAVERVTGHSIMVKYSERRPGDPAVLVSDATKAMAELNWQPNYPDLYSIIEHAWRVVQKTPSALAASQE